MKKKIPPILINCIFGNDRSTEICYTVYSVFTHLPSSANKKITYWRRLTINEYFICRATLLRVHSIKWRQISSISIEQTRARVRVRANECLGAWKRWRINNTRMNLIEELKMGRNWWVVHLCFKINSPAPSAMENWLGMGSLNWICTHYFNRIKIHA